MVVQAAKKADAAAVPVKALDGADAGSEQLALNVAPDNTARGLVHKYLVYVQTNQRAVCGSFSSRRRGSLATSCQLNRACTSGYCRAPRAHSHAPRFGVAARSRTSRRALAMLAAVAAGHHCSLVVASPSALRWGSRGWLDPHTTHSSLAWLHADWGLAETAILWQLRAQQKQPAETAAAAGV